MDGAGVRPLQVTDSVSTARALVSFDSDRRNTGGEEVGPAGSAAVYSKNARSFLNSVTRARAMVPIRVGVGCGANEGVMQVM